MPRDNDAHPTTFPALGDVPISEQVGKLGRDGSLVSRSPDSRTTGIEHVPISSTRSPVRQIDNWQQGQQ